MMKFFFLTALFLLGTSVQAQNNTVKKVGTFNELRAALNNNSYGIVEVTKTINAGSKNVIITRDVIIRGLKPAGNIPRNLKGAYKPENLTKINNIRFFLQNKKVTFEHLNITGHSVNNNFQSVISKQISQPVGGTFKFTNVKLRAVGETIGFNGSIGCTATFTNVTMVNYRAKGILIDRLRNNRASGKLTVDKCLFVPGTNVAFSTRAVSLDAGNTEYPVIWNFRNSILKNSLIINGGFAGSRVRNISIQGNTFLFVKKLYKVDNEESINFSNSNTVNNSEAIHIEEFASNIKIGANTYTYETKIKRGIVFDKEHQPVNNIRISNAGTWNGGNNIPQFKVTGWSPQNTTIPSALSRKLNIEESIYRREFWVNGDTSADNYAKIWANAANFRTNGTFVTPNSRLGVPFGDLLTKWVQIKRGTRYLMAPTNNRLGAVLSGTNGNSKYAQWKIIKAPNRPINVILVNRGNPNYVLYCPKGYTESDYFGGRLTPDTNVIGFRKTNNLADIPTLVLRRVKTGNIATSKWYIHAGGNERRTRISLNGNDVVAKPAANFRTLFGNPRFIAYNHDGVDQWEILPTATNTSTQKNDLGKDEVKEASLISVYGDSNSINVILNNVTSEDAKVNIFDLTGKKLLDDTVVVQEGENKMSYSSQDLDLSKGIFIVRVVTQSGKVFVNKLLIE